MLHIILQQMFHMIWKCMAKPGLTSQGWNWRSTVVWLYPAFGLDCAAGVPRGLKQVPRAEENPHFLSMFTGMFLLLLHSLMLSPLSWGSRGIVTVAPACSIWVAWELGSCSAVAVAVAPLWWCCHNSQISQPCFGSFRKSSENPAT